MSKLLDYTVEILVATIVLAGLVTVGYMATRGIQQNQEFKTQCIAAGMQYVNGSCVK